MVNKIKHHAIQQFLDAMNKLQEKPAVLLVTDIYSSGAIQYSVWGVAAAKYHGKYVPPVFLASFEHFEEAMLWIELDLQIDKDHIEQRRVDFRNFTVE